LFGPFATNFSSFTVVDADSGGRIVGQRDIVGAHVGRSIFGEVVGEAI
jgi:hypothetical protein